MSTRTCAPPSRRRLWTVLAVLLLCLVADGCRRDGDPGESVSAGSEASVFRNLGKR